MLTNALASRLRLRQSGEDAMSIPVKCTCGRTLLLRPEFAGKRVKCPLCKASLQVPTEKPKEKIESDFEIVEKETIESNFEIVEKDDFVSDFEIVDDEQKPAKPASSQAIVATRRPAAGASPRDEE